MTDQETPEQDDLEAVQAEENAALSNNVPFLHAELDRLNRQVEHLSRRLTLKAMRVRQLERELDASNTPSDPA